MSESDWGEDTPELPPPPPPEHDAPAPADVAVPAGLDVVGAAAEAVDAAVKGAVRKEVAAMFPEGRLEEIPSNHPIFRAAFPLERVGLTPTLLKAQPSMEQPLLEGVFVEKELVVVYSKYAIFCRIKIRQVA